MTKISILGGTGGMGSLFANFWKESGHEVATFGSDLKDVQKIADSEIVVFAVPKDKIKEITEKISDHLNQNQTVVSFSSYLGEEKEIFKNIVGEYTFIHAMFGPDILDFKGQNFIASKTDNSKFNELISAIEKSGANIMRIEYKEHDELMSYIQALSQFSTLALAHTLRESGFSEKQLDDASSVTFRINTENIKRIFKQKVALWKNIQFENKYFPELLKKYKDVIEKMEKVVLDKDGEKFEKEFELSKDFFNSRKEEISEERSTNQKINDKSVALLGPEGTYSHEALKNWNKSKQPYFCDTISDAIKMLEKGKVKNAILPFENSIHGTVIETLDKLSDAGLKIYDEFSIPINHCVATLNVSKKENITTIFSHPQALGQCKKYIEDNFPGAKVLSMSSTSSGFKKIKDEQLENAAAIGSPFAAKLFDLNILEENISDVENNRTLFVVVSNQKELPPAPHTLLVLRPHDDRAGLLHDILTIFKENSINLLKLESRPSRRKLGEYIFYIKLEITNKDDKLLNTQKKLKEQDIPFTILTS
jgi:prephenate dehydratase/prephenate dehydrogenase